MINFIITLTNALDNSGVEYALISTPSVDGYILSIDGFEAIIVERSFETSTEVKEND